MLPFVLYAATGVVTAFHLYYLLVLAAFGVPQNPWEIVSLLLSLCILGCAYLYLYKPVLASRIVLIATLGMWFFYGPAIVSTARAGHLTRMAKIQGAALPYSAVLLLLLATAYSFFASGRKSGAGVASTWLFPTRTARLGRITAIVVSVLAIVAVAAWFSRGSQASQPARSRFLIPDGYVGWVHVEFDVPGAEPVSSEQGEYEFKIPADGKLSTSSLERFGWSNDEYFYVSASGLRPLPTRAGSNRMVWGKINGERGDASSRRQYEEFFVGTEQQFKESAGSREASPPSPTSK